MCRHTSCISVLRFLCQVIGSVVRNPEILQLVPLILAALDNPQENTDAALKALMATSFVHAVDPPSLALLVPILRRGLKSTKMSTKLMSAQVGPSVSDLVCPPPCRPRLTWVLSGRTIFSARLDRWRCCPTYMH